MTDLDKKLSAFLLIALLCFVGWGSGSCWLYNRERERACHAAGGALVAPPGAIGTDNRACFKITAEPLVVPKVNP